MAQAGEAAREHVQAEPADELAGVEGHGLELVAMGVVAPSEAHVFAVEVDEAVIGDGALVGVAPEVGHDVARPVSEFVRLRWRRLPVRRRTRTRTWH